MAFFSRPQPTAVRIARPSADSEDAVRQTPPRKDSVQRQCRNIVIYGHCRFQDKGCTYYHPPTEEAQVQVPTSPTPQRVSSPAIATITSQAVNAPIFVPKFNVSSPPASRDIGSPAPSFHTPQTPTPQSRTPRTFTPQARTPSQATTPPTEETDQETPLEQQYGADGNGNGVYEVYEQQQTEDAGGYEQEQEYAQGQGYMGQGQEQGYVGQEQGYTGQGQEEYTGYGAYEYQTDQLGGEMQNMELTDASYYEGYPHDMMEASYYNAAPVFLRQPLNYLLYAPLTPAEQKRNPHSTHFVPSSTELRQLLQERGETARAVNPVDLGLPEELQGYHTLVPIDGVGAVGSGGIGGAGNGTSAGGATGTGTGANGPGERKKLGNWHSTVYKATRTTDGVVHCLRRIENFRLTHQAAFGPIETWSQIQHPNIVWVCEAFTTRSFNDNSLVVSYTYHPNAQTLYDLHMKPKPIPAASSHGYQQPVYYAGRHHQQRGGHHPQGQGQGYGEKWIEERTLWSYVVQIASAIKAVHSRGLAVRMVDASKILVTGKNRVRISSCGIFDVLLFGTPQPDIASLQQEDLLKFGRLIFALCSGNLAAATQANLQKSVEAMKKAYSVEVQALALFLCSKIQKNIDQVLDMIRPKILQEQDEALMATDRLENELMGELENARLFRLMCKFGFINERPEFARDARWSETGDRYIIKLFRDYVFHQVDEHGNPVLDLSHVLTCLNKLDAGTDEKLMLIARDEQSCLVVSYKDIKTCVSNAFEDLVRATTAVQSGKDARVI